MAQGSIPELIEHQTKEVLGNDTIVAGQVNNEPGVWVSMQIEGDDYWLLIRSDLLDPPFGTAWIWWAFVAFLVGTMGATVLTQRTVRPLAELSAAAKKLGRGEKPEPYPRKPALQKLRLSTRALIIWCRSSSAWKMTVNFFWPVYPTI